LRVPALHAPPGEQHGCLVHEKPGSKGVVQVLVLVKGGRTPLFAVKEQLRKLVTLPGGAVEEGECLVAVLGNHTRHPEQVPPSDQKLSVPRVRSGSEMH